MKFLKGLKIFGFVILGIFVLMTILNLIPPKKALKDNPFISNGKTMVAAHRGGGANNPENTLKAFKGAAFEYNAEVMETDLYLTKDGYLVCSHDSTVNRTSDAVSYFNIDKAHRIEDYTLAELKELNFGYNFKDEEGNYPYRNLCDGLSKEDRIEVLKNNDLCITEVNDLFAAFYDTLPNELFIVEVKGEGERALKATDDLVEMINTNYPNFKRQIVISTFSPETENYLSEKYSDNMIGASMGSATKFLISQMVFSNFIFNFKCCCLQLPMEMYGFNLTKKIYIKQAHRRNMAVQYWTINEEEDMKMLISHGADAIMSDNPKLLRKVVDEYYAK